MAKTIEEKILEKKIERQRKIGMFGKVSVKYEANEN